MPTCWYRGMDNVSSVALSVMGTGLHRVVAMSTFNVFFKPDVNFRSPKMYWKIYQGCNLNRVRNPVQAHEWGSLEAAEVFLKKRKNTVFLMKWLL